MVGKGGDGLTLVHPDVHHLDKGVVFAYVIHPSLSFLHRLISPANLLTTDGISLLDGEGLEKQVFLHVVRGVCPLEVVPDCMLEIMHVCGAPHLLWLEREDF